MPPHAEVQSTLTKLLAVCAQDGLCPLVCGALLINNEGQSLSNQPTRLIQGFDPKIQLFERTSVSINVKACCEKVMLDVRPRVEMRKYSD